MATVSQISVQFIAHTDRLRRGVEDALKQLARLKTAQTKVQAAPLTDDRAERKVNRTLAERLILLKGLADVAAGIGKIFHGGKLIVGGAAELTGATKALQSAASGFAATATKIAAPIHKTRQKRQAKAAVRALADEMLQRTADAMRAHGLYGTPGVLYTPPGRSYRDVYGPHPFGGLLRFGSQVPPRGKPRVVKDAVIITPFEKKRIGHNPFTPGFFPYESKGKFGLYHTRTTSGYEVGFPRGNTLPQAYKPSVTYLASNKRRQYPSPTIIPTADIPLARQAGVFTRMRHEIGLMAEEFKRFMLPGFVRDLKFIGRQTGRIAKGVGYVGVGTAQTLYGAGRLGGTGVTKFAPFLAKTLNEGLGIGLTSILGLGLKLIGVFTKLSLVIGGVFVTATLGAAAAFTTFVVSSVRAAAEVGRMAHEFGVTAAGMQVLQSTAARFGIQTSSMERMLGRLAANLGAVKNGVHQAIIDFRMVGVAGGDLAKMPIDEAFFTIIDHLRTLPTLADQARVAYVLFGRDFRKVLRLANDPLMNRKQITTQLGQAGLLQTQGQSEQIERAAQALSRLQEMFQGFRTQLAVQLAPIVEEIGNGIANWVGKGSGMSGFVASFLEGLKNVLAVTADFATNVLSFILKTAAVLLEVTAQIASFIGTIQKSGSFAAGVVHGLIPGLGSEDTPGKTMDQTVSTLNSLTNSLEKFSATLDTSNLGNKIRSTVDAVLQKAFASQHGAVMAAAAIGGVVGGPLGASVAAMDVLAEAAKKAGIGLHDFAGRVQHMLDATGQFRERPLSNQFAQNVDFFKKLGPQVNKAALPDAAMKAGLGSIFGPFGAMRGMAGSLTNNGFITADDQARGMLKMLEDAEGKLHVHTASPAGTDIRSSQAGEMIANLRNNAPLSVQARIARDIAAMKAQDAERTVYARDIRNAIINIKKVDKF